MLEKKKLRDIAESISGIRPENRSLEGIVSFIEEQAEITYEKQPRTFLGRLRELGYALNGVRPTQRSLRGIVNAIYEGFSPEPPVPPVSNKIYGVKNMFNTDYLSRTDDAEEMTYTKKADGTVVSDFDKVFPYNQMKRVEITHPVTNRKNVFVKIPAMWFRIGLAKPFQPGDKPYQITDIAVSQVKGEGDNWYQTKEFYYGAYSGAHIYYQDLDINCLESYSANMYPSEMSLKNARKYANGNGENYQLLDLYHRTIINFLFLIEFANKRSNEVFPMAFDSKQRIGLTDTIKTPTGALENGRFRWRYIEDLFGNTCEFLDGVLGNYYASSDPSKYASGDLDELSYTNTSNDNRIKNLCWDSENPFLVMAQTTNSQDFFREMSDTMTSTEKNNGFVYTCGKAYTDNENNNAGLLSVESVTQQYSPSIPISARLLYCPNGV